MSAKRAITGNGTCHKDCAYYGFCKGFRNKHKRCPRWTQDVPLVCFARDVVKSGETDAAQSEPAGV